VKSSVVTSNFVGSKLFGNPPLRIQLLSVARGQRRTAAHSMAAEVLVKNDQSQITSKKVKVK